MALDAGTTAAVAAFTVVALQRLAELWYSRRTGGRLAAAGARLVPRDGYALLVAVHVLFFPAAASEVWARGASVGAWTVAGGLLFLAGAGLRYWSMAALGWRWHVRVYVLPAAPLVTRGPYRFLRHPIYVGVTLELAGLPLAFGLWWTLVGVGAANAAALWVRIRAEDRALGRPTPQPAAGSTHRRP